MPENKADGKTTYTIDMDEEEKNILAELAHYLKNSRAGAVKFAVKHCHKVFVKAEKETERGREEKVS